MISPGPGLVGVDPLERLGDREVRDLDALDRAVGAAPRRLLVALDGALEDAADREAAEVGRRVEVGHERLQRVALLVRGRRDRRDDRVEQRPERLAVHVGVERRLAGARVAVDDREVDLALVGIEIEEQLVDLVDDLGDARIRAVDLVDHEHDGQPGLERLAQHEARLRERALAGVDQQQHAVDHRQPALDLAAEVGVAGRVDDVDLDVAVADGRVLGQDRDALLTLQIAAVHDALGDVLADAERAGLPEHRVDEGGLAVVDVRHDGDVAEVVSERSHTPRVAAVSFERVRATLAGFDRVIPVGRSTCAASCRIKTRRLGTRISAGGDRGFGFSGPFGLALEFHGPKPVVLGSRICGLRVFA